MQILQFFFIESIT